MPFLKGQSGNPGGRIKRAWLNEQRRVLEGKRAFDRLLEIRDAKIREQVIKDGEVYDVVPSVKEIREACRLILAYCWGLPAQHINLADNQGGELDLGVNIILRPGENSNGADPGVRGSSKQFHLDDC